MKNDWYKPKEVQQRKKKLVQLGMDGYNGNEDSFTGSVIAVYNQKNAPETPPEE